MLTLSSVWKAEFNSEPVFVAFLEFVDFPQLNIFEFGKESFQAYCMNKNIVFHSGNFFLSKITVLEIHSAQILNCCESLVKNLSEN